MMNKLSEMSNKLAVAHVEADKFIGGNKSAGERLRKCMQEIKELAGDVRKSVLSVRKGGTE